MNLSPYLFFPKLFNGNTNIIIPQENKQQEKELKLISIPFFLSLYSFSQQIL